MQQRLYRDLAKYYDLVYSYKDYRKEVEFIHSAARMYGVPGRELLDVGCGTGSHARLLAKKGYSVTALDRNAGILSIARRKVPEAAFVQGDMRRFQLERRFDIITCLFSAVNYNLRKHDLVATFRNFRRHLSNRGILVFDAPLPGEPVPELFRVGEGSAVLYENKDIGRLREVTLHLLLAEGGDELAFKDVHRIRLYTLEELGEAVENAGFVFDVYWDFQLSAVTGRWPVLVCKQGE